MADRKKPKSHHFTAATITALYAVTAVAWIFVSDFLLVLLVDDPDNFIQYHSLKDWTFVLITILLVFYLVRFHLRKYSHYMHKFKSQRSEMHILSQFRKSIIDNASIWINVLDRQGHVTVWNKAAEQLSGYRREEVLKNAKIWEWLYPDLEYRASVRKLSHQTIEEGVELQGFETVIHTKSGEEKIISWNSRRFLNDTDEVMGAIVIGHDITERKRAQRALQEREHQLVNLMDNLPGMAYRRLNDDMWTMKFVSSGCRKLTGYDSTELMDNRELSFASILHEDDLTNIRRMISRAQALKRSFAMEYRIRRRDGNLIWVWEQGRSLTIGKAQFLEGIILDINQRKIMERELERLATHDPLTGLYNRRELEQQLSDELARAHRYQRPLSLLLLDVDHFKVINDRFGHLVGDQVLRQLSQLLQSCVRAVDYVARYGGEELVIVLPEVDGQEALEMAERLRGLVEAKQMPVADDKQVGVTVSIGIASFPLHGRDIAHLFRKADEAMYRAKREGRNRVVGAA